MKRNNYMRFTLIAAVIAIATVLLNTYRQESTPFHPRDYGEIRHSGILRAVLEYSSASYHVSGDTIEGFDYELLKDFATTKGLQLEVEPEMSYQKRVEGVCQGRYDLIASATAITSESRDTLLFTRPLSRSRQVLVQRKIQDELSDSLFIRTQTGLAGRQVHLIKGSPASLRMTNIISEIADTIYISELDSCGGEQLLAMVSAGDIDYAVCDEATAMGVINQFPNLDISTAISFTQLYAWAVSKLSPDLLDTLNAFLDLRLK